MTKEQRLENEYGLALFAISLYCHSREICARAGGVAGIHSYRHSRESGNPGKKWDSPYLILSKVNLYSLT
jgi:hypothetical protein